MTDRIVPKFLGSVSESPPTPAPILLVPAMIEPNKSDPQERWLLQCARGKWRYMTADDLVAVVMQLDRYDAARVRDAASHRVESESARDGGEKTR